MFLAAVIEGRILRTALFTALVIALQGAASAGTIRSDRDPQAYLNLGSSPEYASVGLMTVTATTPGFLGSGTLVSDHWVLTAAHLLEDANTATINLGGIDYSATGWITHKKWSGEPRRGYDIALVKLATPVSGITPAGIYRGHDEFQQTAIFVGNGRTGTGDTGAITFDGLKRAGQNVIDGMSVGKEKIYTTKLSRSARVFIVDFDNPARPGDNVTGSAEPADLEYLISHGDSGGPVFLPSADGPLIAGIHSYGEAPVGLDDSGYGDITGHTRVSKYYKWIQRTIKKDQTKVEAIPGAGTLGRSLPIESIQIQSSQDVPEPTALLALMALGIPALLRRPRRCNAL